MAGESEAGVSGALRQMVRRAPPARPDPGDAGGLCRAAPRVMDRVARVPVALGAAVAEAMSRDELAAALPGTGLVLRLAASGAISDGLAWLAPDLFAAIVERRLTGTMRPAPPPGRPATPLDAVICGEVVEALCAEPGVIDGAPLRPDGHLRDPDLAVFLPDIPFRVIRLHLGLGRDGGRGGEIGLAIPDPPPEERPAAMGLPRADLMGCRAELLVSLPPVVLPWARVAGLAPGDLLTLGEGAIDAARLTSIAGAPVASGRLGRLGDARALRVHPALAAGPSGSSPIAQGAEEDVGTRPLPELPGLPDAVG